MELVKSKTEILENTDFKFINNCCKDLYAIRNILQQCECLGKEELQIIASEIDMTADAIQEDCIDLLDTEEKE